ncbi:MAG: hypothetical protein MK105_09400 [Crocinitomicaceae bacterium]|nr:hypothetical protein [Crocinitomicaceae bacterium]
MKHIYLIFTFLIATTCFSQVNEDLTPEERAYLYHVVKKSPILNNNFGRYFDYQGPVIKFPNQKINYDSVELLIINNPELLVIRKHEISKSAKGLIAEASNKMALWELNKVLLAKRENPNDLKQYKNEYNRFESILIKKLPPNATKPKNGEIIPQPKLQNLMNPSLSLDDKLMHIKSMRFLTQNDQLVTLKAINESINEYVQARAFEIFNSLGGKADMFENVLVAAGDGSSTTGILEEREKDEQGRWNKGLPKAVGLFPYQLHLQKTIVKKKEISDIEPMRYTENNFKTFGNNRITNIHTDVWGYNSEKQTTVVFEKNGLNYHLFGSTDTRFLSPDSSFGGSTTFQSIINDLEFNKIAKLKEMIYGKKGFDHWIEYNQKKKDATEMKIEKREKDYSDMGYSPISTSSKPSRKVKKSKRKAIKNGSGSFDAAPTTSSNKKDRKKLQNTIVGLYKLFDAYKIKIAELEADKAKAVDLMAQYNLKLDRYKQIMGLRWATYTEKDGLYTFQDSSTFDILTQEFKFAPKAEVEDFEVRLIAIPESSLSKNADEVMLHINIMDAEPNYDARINLELKDVFASDKWELPTPLFNDDDSVALCVFFESLLNKKTSFNMVCRGQGIGKWDGVQTVKNCSPNELNKYPGNSAESKFDSTFVRLRKSELMIHIDRSIYLQINSFTDPVKSNLNITNDNIRASMLKYKLSKNDILSAYRTAEILRRLKSEINVIAGKYLSRDQAKIVIDRFNKKWAKTRISVGATSFKQGDLN